MIADIKNIIKQIASAELEIEVSASDKPEFGHYSTNVAFKLAPIVKKAPFEIAKDLAEKLSSPSTNSGPIFAKVEAVPPGFINFWIAPAALQNGIKEILSKKSKYGQSNVKGQMSKVNLEYVSANPTGPLTMANGRGGFYGTALANVLEKAGHKVTREYYVNDAGNQVKGLGMSIWTAREAIKERRKKEEYIDKLAYRGEYIDELAKDKRLAKYKDAEYLGMAATKILLIKIKKSLKSAGIKHETFFSEDENLHKKGELQRTLEFLEKRGVIEKKEDGSIWLGDGVLIKSDIQKTPTYFLADLAYHYDKLIKRKFDLAIDIWGADHHGYAQRMKKGVEALGLPGDKLEILITQLVRLVSGGKEVRMSKRKGEFITMDDLLEEVGADAAKFFFLMHSLDTHMDFDMDLAKEKSNKNPVFYSQYALVRCENILRKSKVKSLKSKVEFTLLKSEAEVRLMLELMKFPDLIAQTARDYQVHHLTKYAGDVARALHNFYEKERVVGLEDRKLGQARMALVSATKIVLENLFDILGISKPKKM